MSKIFSILFSVLKVTTTIILTSLCLYTVFTTIKPFYTSRYSNNIQNTESSDINNTKNNHHDIHSKYVKKVAIVVSHYLNDPSSQPQKMGFTDNIQSIDNRYYWWMEGFYMKTKLVNKFQSNIQNQADYIIENIEHEIHPHIILTIDDDAFTYGGGILSKKNYQVFAIGLNNDLSYYNNLYDKNNTVMIFKTPDYNHLKSILIKTNTIDYFSKMYIITSYLPTKSELYTIKQYKKTFNKILPIEIVNFKTTVELINWLKNNNKSNSRYIYVLAIQRCYDSYTSAMINELRIAEIISKYNTKHLEISNNPILSKYGETMLSYGPDYIDIGKQVCYLMKKYNSYGKIENKVIYLPSRLVVNISRFKKDLVLNNIYNDLYPYIYQIY